MSATYEPSRGRQYMHGPMPDESLKAFLLAVLTGETAFEDDHAGAAEAAQAWFDHAEREWMRGHETRRCGACGGWGWIRVRGGPVQMFADAMEQARDDLEAESRLAEGEWVRGFVPWSPVSGCGPGQVRTIARGRYLDKHPDVTTKENPR